MAVYALGDREPTLGKDVFIHPDATVIGAESPNGNSVSLEDQMTRAADIRQSHDLAMGVYQKSLDILRATIRK